MVHLVHLASVVYLIKLVVRTRLSVGGHYVDHGCWEGGAVKEESPNGGSEGSTEYSTDGDVLRSLVVVGHTAEKSLRTKRVGGEVRKKRNEIEKEKEKKQEKREATAKEKN